MSTTCNLLLVLSSVLLVQSEFIFNPHYKEHLMSGYEGFTKYDTSRRNIATVSALIGGNLVPGEGWDIIPYGDYHRIRNHKTKEYLYAAADQFRHDSSRRSVFTWIPDWKDEGDKQGLWDLETEGKAIYFRNVAFDEYLYAANGFNFPDGKRRVFTWKSSRKDVGPQGMWNIMVNNK